MLSPIQYKNPSTLKTYLAIRNSSETKTYSFSIIIIKLGFNLNWNTCGMNCLKITYLNAELLLQPFIKRKSFRRICACRGMWKIKFRVRMVMVIFLAVVARRIIVATVMTRARWWGRTSTSGRRARASLVVMAIVVSRGPNSNSFYGFSRQPKL